MSKQTGMSREVRECLAEMGVTEEVFAKVRSASNHTDGEKFLDEAKEICRKGFRSVAKKYHPDLNQHLSADELKAKEERFKRLRSVCDSFLDSRYRGPRRSSTQMGATDFDPFGLYNRDQSIESLLRSLRRTSSPVDIVDQLKEEGRRRAKIRMAYDIFNGRYDDQVKPKAPPPPPGTSPVTMPKGVWHRNEASCQPQQKPTRKPKTTP